MSEQAPVEDTPDLAAAATGEEQQLEAAPVDWEERYRNLQADYTRATQELAPLKPLQGLLSDDEETRLAALAAAGYEFAEPDYVDPNTPDPDLDPTGAKLAQLEAQLAEINNRDAARSQAEADRREQEKIDAIDASCQQQLADIDGLDAATRDWIYSRALVAHHTPEGLPDIQAAHQEFVEFENARQKQWATSKQAPHIPGSGTSATQVPNLDDPAQRHAWMRERMRANADQ